MLVGSSGPRLFILRFGMTSFNMERFKVTKSEENKMKYGSTTGTGEMETSLVRGATLDMDFNQDSIGKPAFLPCLFHLSASQLIVHPFPFQFEL